MMHYYGNQFVFYDKFGNLGEPGAKKVFLNI